MPPTYKGARLKIKRADKHITDLETSINVLKKRLVVAAHVNLDTGCEFIKCDFAGTADRETMGRLPLLIGDAIHNLKCALDYAWLETVNRMIPGRDWSRSKFPSFAARNELEAGLSKLEINIAAPHLFTLLVGDIKPHDGGDFFIRSIHGLDLRDKHRLLIPIVHYSSIGHIDMKDAAGNVHRGGSTWGTTDPLPHFLHFVRGLHIENPGSASFDVMFEEREGGREMRTVDTLRVYEQSVSIVVEKLEALVQP